MILKYNNGTEYIELPIIDSISLSKSSREVLFSDISVDFTGYTISDLPIKLQEVQIIDNSTVIYYGYIDSFKLPRYDKATIVNKVNFTLISPLAMLSKRSITVTGTYTLRNLIDYIFTPLYEDGFVLFEYNVSDRNITVNFVMQTIETIINYLSNILGLWIYIDELKRITVNTLDYQFAKDPVLNMTSYNYKTIDSIWYIEPSVSSADYANVINVKNARVYYDSASTNDTITGGTLIESEYPLFDVVKTLKQGDTVNFVYPVDISETNLRKIRQETNTPEVETIALQIEGFISPSTHIYEKVYISTETSTYDNYIVTSGIGFDEDNYSTTFTLIRDRFFSNLITGIRYNGTSDLPIYSVKSETALVPSAMRFVNTLEIDTNKYKTSNSGIIEKVLDLNQRWFTRIELLDYIRSLLINNSNQTDSLEIAFKGSQVTDYKIGDKVYINIPELFTVGNFVVTDSQYIDSASQVSSIVYNLRSANMLENYIDLFRREQNEENTDQLNNIILSDFVKETIVERHEVI